MNRRKLIPALVALPFIGSFAALSQTVQSKEGIQPLKGDVDFNMLQSWIKEWPIAQLSSEMSYADAPSGKRLSHQILKIGTRFKLTDKEMEFCWNGKPRLRILDYCKAHREPPSEWLRSNCSNYKAAELFLCGAVANTLYYKALGQTTVYWREPLEIDAIFDFNFVPDAAGPDTDYATDQKGHRYLLGGLVRLYARLSFDDPDFYSDVLRLREGGSIRYI
jgi:hypothetical protein